MNFYHTKNKISDLGGKAAKLFDLVDYGFNVPEFCVLSGKEINQIAGEGSTLKNSDISSDFIQSILHFMGDCDRFAVRSSADSEDGISSSFAGQFVSLLNVGKSDLIQAICEVYNSGFSERSIKYAHNRNVLPGKVSVIIQKCIEASASGVAFAADPVSGDTKLVLINAVYGLGEGLVSGEFNSDEYKISLNGAIEKNIAVKDEMLVCDKQSGLKKEKVSLELRQAAVLSDSQISVLAKQIRQLEKLLGFACDVEFCVKDDVIYFLQVRPITALKTDVHYTIWDNSNIIESYPGVTLPLTFSFISPVYAAVYQQLCKVLGVSQKSIDDNLYTFQNMLGLLRGRVYYNLYSWYKLLSLLPGYSINAAFMEKMMGVSERFELKDYKKPSGFRAYLSLLRMFFSLIKNMILLPSMRQSFRRKFESVMEQQAALNIDTADAYSCMMAYNSFETILVKYWKAPLVNDFYAMIFYGTFQKFLDRNKKYLEDDINAYLSGTGKVITVEPAEWQADMCEYVKNDSSLKQLFFELSAEEIHQWILQNPDNVFSIKFNNYIEKWGDRCFAELKLETITYRQDPVLLLSILKQTIGLRFNRNDQSESRNLKNRLPLVKKFIFYGLRKLAITSVTERENLRFERTRAFAHVRKIMLRIGEVLLEQKILDHKRDVFYLGKNELFDFIKGTALSLDLRTIVEKRKEEFALYMKEPIQSPRIRTEGIVYQNGFAAKINDDTVVLKGIPCCKGVVRAKVKVLYAPEELETLEGCIMVTGSTDPGWVSVFPLVSGILVERGSVLSHAAIVSREMNIPCIVGIKNICNTLKDGDLIEMDGSTGEIKILEVS
ncbi:MAG TPA: PEP/pyruvate-binding domain-containing protein [Bacteroidia bacterium]